MLSGQSAWKLALVCLVGIFPVLYLLHDFEVPRLATYGFTTSDSVDSDHYGTVLPASDSLDKDSATVAPADKIAEPLAGTSISPPGTAIVLHKPPQRIVGLVFAGRQEYVSILDCYLRRNLVRNGGWLDEVLWLISTPSKWDEAYLMDLVAEVPEYTSHHASEFEPEGKKDYSARYQYCQRNTIYVKIDDDVVFFEDETIARVVQRLIESPQYLAVSANVMNQPAMSWTQFHLDVALPFLPELIEGPSNTDEAEDILFSSLEWRPSKLPEWRGPAQFRFSEKDPAPFKNHRWLLAKDFDLEFTPLGALGRNANHEYVANSTGWHSWAIAAQEHYSFLTHLENKELHRYKFDMWHMHYDRLSINFLAFRGDDIKAHPVSGSDEHYLTVTLPLRLRRPVVIEGQGLAVHFGFHRQVYGHGGVKGRALNDTDLILRYKKYAEEFVCNRPWGSPMYP